MRTRNFNRRRGFTLVEMLVVLGIMVLLAAILFGVFSRVRQHGQRSTCQSNLKQIALGMQQYVQDSGGYYPVATDSSTGALWPYELVPYIKNDAIFRCPVYGPLENPQTYGFPLNYTNYSYNLWRLNDRPRFSARHEVTLPLSSQTWMNFCATPWLGVGTGPVIRLSSSCERKHFFEVPTNHLGGTNWSFLDGHVKWMTPQQVVDLDCANPPLGPEANFPAGPEES